MAAKSEQYHQKFSIFSVENGRATDAKRERERGSGQAKATSNSGLYPIWIPKKLPPIIFCKNCCEEIFWANFPWKQTDHICYFQRCVPHIKDKTIMKQRLVLDRVRVLWLSFILRIIISSFCSEIPIDFNFNI